MKRFIVYSLISFFAMALSLPSPLSFWQKRAIEQVPQHEVTVTLKLVHVYVTDKQGNPVVDLNREDFAIYDNGKKQVVTDFERHIHSFILEKLRKKEEIAETQVPEARQLMNRKFFLLFDFAHNNPKGVMAAKKVALHFLEKMVQPSDEIGILSYSPSRGLALHEYLSTDHGKIKKFIESLGLKDSLGNVENLEIKYWEEITGQNPLDVSKTGGVFKRDELDEFKKEKPKGELSPEAQRFLATGESRFHALSFINRLSDLAKALRYIPGIKYILLFSSGIPYSLIYGIQAPWGTRNYGAWGETLIREKQEEMHRELVNSNTVVYAFDTEDSVARITQDTRMTGAFTLQQLTSTTGGKYFGNIDKYEQHLEQVERLTGCYYVLGYYVDEKWDGKYHEIRVEVKRPGVKVYAQRGYFNPKSFKEWTDLEKILHLVDLALSERPLFQTPLPLRCGGFTYFAGGKENLVLWAELVKEELIGLAGGEVEVVYLVFDREGNMVKMRRRAEAFDKLASEAIYFSPPFVLSPGEYRLRVVVRSLETGRGAVGSADLVLFRANGGGLSLSQPLLLKESESKRYENMPPFLFSFDMKKFVPVSRQLKPGEREFYVLLSCSFSGLRDPETRIYGQLLKVEGEKTRSIPLHLILLRKEQGEGEETSLIKLEMQPLEPGPYYLYFHSEEKKSSSRAVAHVPLTVKD